MILGDIETHFHDFGNLGDQLEIRWIFRAGLKHPQILGTILLEGNVMLLSPWFLDSRG